MPKNVALNLLWVLWGACLVGYVVYDLFFYLLLAPTFFLIFILINIMFKKKISNHIEVSPVTNSALQSTASTPPTDTAKTNTIIAVGTKIKGNINLDGDIQIYGAVIGDIAVNEGTIRLMRSGQIEGNLTAPHITVDGRVEGVCVSEHLEILENGRLHGIVKGSNFSIKKGGIFIGQSEITDESAGVLQNKSKPAVIVNQEKFTAEEAVADTTGGSK
ncbi:Integral membrane protein CcmA involved in cell shape determination [Yersinia rohdei]|uniref:Integral membrane protein CcmA involved in cell shape determination n=1 Tax=Yersinia rohdei TaxID=29485 RepID=A0A0U1HPT1_YERRO|nr:polymer-forming cytoskeletal protein [Yersinia rohdei]MDN0093727.1 polymer-forming cytoskeletal protein [Yersinia rohdei]CNE44139.1 Integral membrane protein CcmA involved in cell shape determination [Yersinia rohdei]CNI72069.1 Integral membrane protein CcmA involved in cell shape determination [Yersinia rohdei]CQI88581.1 Integral membrane protein CcmA involved in cell shape determination [Yersinia rohdei]